MHDFLLSPFLDYGFMRRALVACFALSLSGAPLGVMLILRRMSLIGDSFSHAILPGVAIAFLLGGLSLPFMSLGGLGVGILLALLAQATTKLGVIKEDTSFAVLFPISLSIGILLLSNHNKQIDLLHLMLGSLLGVDQIMLVTIAAITSVTVIALCISYRALILQNFDPLFTRAHNIRSSWVHSLFLVLLVLNLVAGFQILGTLMVLGLMIVPAASAHFWARSVWRMSVIAILISLLSAYAGLLLSYYKSWPSGPSIIVLTGLFYGFSLLFGRHGGIWQRMRPLPHFKH